MGTSKINGFECSLKNAPRDRLGMWGSGDIGVPGNISGLQRLHHKKYNKVSKV